MAYALCHPRLTPPGLGIFIQPSHAVPTPWWMSMPNGSLAGGRERRREGEFKGERGGESVCK